MGIKLKKLSKHYASLVPRSQKPPGSNTPKPVGGLAPGDVLNSDPTATMILCYRCKTPLWIIYALKELTPFSSEQPPPRSLGPWKPLKSGSLSEKDHRCPACPNMFAKYNDKTQSANYLVSNVDGSNRRLV